MFSFKVNGVYEVEKRMNSLRELQEAKMDVYGISGTHFAGEGTWRWAGEESPC